MDDLAAAAHGFVGADLAAICNEAAMAALRRHISNTRGDAARTTMCNSAATESAATRTQLPGTAAFKQQDAALRVTLNDFRVAETRVQPSAMREVGLEVQAHW